MQLISKQITHPYICSGLGYLAWQLSRAMLFQWGLANRKCPVRQLSATTSSVWRTLCNYVSPLQWYVKNLWLFSQGFKWQSYKICSWMPFSIPKLFTKTTEPFVHTYICTGWYWYQTHFHLNKMAAISQTIFSGAFLWIKSFVFWLKLHWSLFLRVPWIITQHWFR